MSAIVALIRGINPILQRTNMPYFIVIEIKTDCGVAPEVTTCDMHFSAVFTKPDETKR